MRPPTILFTLLTMLFAIYLLSAPTPARSAAAGEQATLDAYIKERMRDARIPGLALGVVRDDQVVYLKGYGVAGPDGRTVTPQTPFILGSTSKSITALAVMQLVEAGAIDLDAPVTAYLPWFRTADAAASARITVRHLLNQNSGLPVDAGRAGFAADDQSDAALENGVRGLADVQLSNPPGQTLRMGWGPLSPAPRVALRPGAPERELPPIPSFDLSRRASEVGSGNMAALQAMFRF